MRQQKIHFQNKEGQKLTGKLELPADQHPHNYALFAHCFTCGKNLSAVRNISQALTASGFAVLRFDFTGLGESDGSFEDTNFSGNVEDLVAASRYLEENYQAPSLLIGHSLGGAAAIFAASDLSNIKAVATIGAPSNPEHVQHLFQSELEEIEKNGVARVLLSGRPFTIKKQFVEDLKTKSLPQVAKDLRKPLLILHSPQDRTVTIENAETIYKSSFHPKSFVSLDGADHLLDSKADSIYVGQVIASWASRYLHTVSEDDTLRSKHQVAARLNTEDDFTTKIKADKHYFTADEPISYGGQDFGPSPYELLSSSLAACTAMTLQMYARRKNWDLQEVQVHINHSKQHALDAENADEKGPKLDTFDKEIHLIGDLDEQQKARLLEIADRCPVHRTLHAPVVTKSELK